MTEEKLQIIVKKLNEETMGSPFENHVFVVGGAVRDFILKRPINDIDIVVDLPMGGIAFAEWITRKLGVYKKDSNPILYGRFGTAQFRIWDVEIESVMSRQEAYVQGSRKPTVKFGTMKQDAFRRDLTINSLVLNISKGDILDLTGAGFQDIKDARIKTTSDPTSIFNEDPLRMLRVARFGGQLYDSHNFEISKPTLQAMFDNAKELVNISKERIRDELTKMIMSSNPTFGIQVMLYTGLMDYVIPEFKGIVALQQNKYHVSDVYGHTLDVMTNTPKILVVRLAALLHDIGKQNVVTKNSEGTNSFHGHEKESADMAIKILTDLKFPKVIIDSVAHIIEMHMTTKQWGFNAENVKDKTLRKFLKKSGEHLDDLLALIHADNLCHAKEYSTPEQVAKIKERLKNLKDKNEPEKMPITGKDIMEFFEVKTGKRVGELLKIAENFFLEDPTIQKEDLLFKIKETTKGQNV